MREILFHGKRLDNGEWVEGNYILQNDSDPKRANYMVPHIKLRNCVNMYAVDPSTVGQYTGLKDKNGKRIFEGDIISTGFDIRLVRFRNGAFEITRKAWGAPMFFYEGIGTDIEYDVIGTIHDNPELLEGG